MHIADPTHRHLRRQRDRRRRPADRGGRGDGRAAPRATAASRWRSSATARSAQGAFHEAVNLAAVWRLPVIFFCENNGYAEFSPASTQHAASLEQRAAGYGVDYVAVDGNDVVGDGRRPCDEIGRGRPRRARPGRRRGRRPTAGTATTKATRSATGRPRRSESGRPATRSSSTRARLRASRRRRRRRSSRWSPSVAPELDEAVEAARRLARPGAGHADRLRASAPRPERPEPAPPAADAPGLPHDGRRSAPRSRPSSPSDDRVFVAGIDVGAGGNVFGLTRGLHDRFGDRVRDTPISETAIMGLGVGAAMAGMRPWSS